jgi:hypothetical protein
MDALAARASSSRGRTAPIADVKSCGPGAPTLASSCAVTNRAMTGARKPGPRGERDISVKTIAQGRPGLPADPVVPSPCFFIARGPWVSVDTRPSLRPLFLRRDRFDAKLGRNAPRERGVIFRECAQYSVVITREKRVIQYAAASRLMHCRLWNTGSPGQAGRRHRGSGCSLRSR